MLASNSAQNTPDFLVSTSSLSLPRHYLGMHSAHPRDNHAYVVVQIKTALIKTGVFEDTMPCHLASGLGAGFFAVICGSPVDVVKSRLMGMPDFPLSSACKLLQRFCCKGTTNSWSTCDSILGDESGHSGMQNLTMSRHTSCRLVWLLHARKIAWLSCAA